MFQTLILISAENHGTLFAWVRVNFQTENCEGLPSHSDGLGARQDITWKQVMFSFFRAKEI